MVAGIVHTAAGLCSAMGLNELNQFICQITVLSVAAKLANTR